MAAQGPQPRPAVEIIVGAGVLAISGFGFVGAAVQGDPDLTFHLEFMAEEERLAHELHTLFAATYPETSIFGTIAPSEQRHMDAASRQLDRYAVGDPGARLGWATTPSTSWTT